MLSITFVEQDLKAGRLVRLLEGFETADTAAEVRLAYIGRALSIDHAAEFFKAGSEAWPRPVRRHRIGAAF